MGSCVGLTLSVALQNPTAAFVRSCMRAYRAVPMEPIMASVHPAL